MTPDARPEKSALGRAIVFTAFGIAAGYIAVVVIGGVVVGLYGGPPAPAPEGALAQKEQAWCSRALVSLRDELDSQVAIELERTPRHGDPQARWLAFQEQWRRSYAPAREHCEDQRNGPLGPAFAQLGALDEAYDDVVLRLTHARSSVATALNAAVDQWRMRH